MKRKKRFTQKAFTVYYTTAQFVSEKMVTVVAKSVDAALAKAKRDLPRIEEEGATVRITGCTHIGPALR